MAEDVYEKVGQIEHQMPFIGHQILDIVTSGMYDDPLMIYREYVQNSVDSIDLAVQDGKLSASDGKISISVSGQNRSIIIEDNGAGLPKVKATKVLLDLGCSPKEGSGQRGFRGIGRLGGLAYCDLLRFETRSSDEEEVTVVEWDKRRMETLAAQISAETSLATVVRNITRTFSRKANEKDLKHFFRVQMENVRKFHSDRLMNIRLIREYLSQVAPVPYDKMKFSYAEKLDTYFAGIAGYKGYNITVNGENILRPYSDKICVSSEFTDEIKAVDCFKFSATDGRLLALGWYAKTSFKASLPSQVTMRGIRIRHGNLEVGDEYFLSPYFTERRFATWNIGEIQIWDNYIKPNARRDGFEQSPEYERFLEQASLLGRRLSGFCRKYSIDRSQKQRIERKIEEVEVLLNRTHLFIDKEHHANLINTARQELDKLLPLIKDGTFSENVLTKYRKTASKLTQIEEAPSFIDEYLDGRSLRHLEKREVVQKIVELILHEYAGSSSANDLIQRILTPFLKPIAKKTVNSRT